MISGSPEEPSLNDAGRRELGWARPDYEEKVVEPTLRAAIREATASPSANALYTGEREMVAKQIFDHLSTELSARGLSVENVLLRDILLPATLKASIQAKQQAERKRWP